jgi:uncharacterized membrane protein
MRLLSAIVCVTGALIIAIVANLLHNQCAEIKVKKRLDFLYLIIDTLMMFSTTLIVLSVFLLLIK